MSYILPDDELQEFAQSKKIILIDGVIFQFYRGSPNGISRVWLSLIPILQNILDDFTFVILRRGEYQCGLPDVCEYLVNEYDFSDNSGGDKDQILMSSLVERFNPVCFMSTFYSRVETCPNILLIHDMIPEVLKEDLNQPMLVAKRKAIENASFIFTVSDSTRRDLFQYYQYKKNNVQTAYNGVSEVFRKSCPENASDLLRSRGLNKEYLLLVGGRGQYKGASRFLKAFSESCFVGQFKIIAVGGEPWLTEDEKIISKKIDIAYTGWISDEDLMLLYCGATALIYPSHYEGFGLPVVEALSCGCPVIVPNHSSIPEVAGDAAIFADPGNPEQLIQALKKLTDEKLVQSLIKTGHQHVKKFNWEAMAEAFATKIKSMAQG